MTIGTRDFGLRRTACRPASARTGGMSGFGAARCHGTPRSFRRRSSWPCSTGGPGERRRPGCPPGHGGGAEARAGEFAALRGHCCRWSTRRARSRTSAGSTIAWARTAAAGRCSPFVQPAEVKGVALLVVNHPTALPTSGCGRPPSLVSAASLFRTAPRDSSARTSASKIWKNAMWINSTIKSSAKSRSTTPRAGRSSHGRRKGKSSQYTSSIVWVRKDNYAFQRIENYVKDATRPPAQVLEDRERAGDLDRAGARDGRPQAQQPHDSHPREARVQRPDEGRELHAAGVAARSVMSRWTAGAAGRAANRSARRTNASPGCCRRRRGAPLVTPRGLRPLRCVCHVLVIGLLAWFAMRPAAPA